MHMLLELGYQIPFYLLSSLINEILEVVPKEEDKCGQVR
jgi:hypothetical protein